MRPDRRAALLVSAVMAGCATERPVPPALPPPAPGMLLRYECRQAVLPVSMDGVITEDEWAEAAWSDQFVDIEGSGHPRPRFETRLKMLWDDKYLYVAARMQEPHVWGTLTQRDDIVFHDNDFEIFIDPDGDTRRYYEIEVNALGTIFDLFLTRMYIEGGQAHHEWNLRAMHWAVHIDGTLNDPSDVDQGWSVEFALPWSGLKKSAGQRCPPRDGDVWRMNFSRVQWRHEIVDGAYRKMSGTGEDNWVWSPQGVIDMHRPQRWGYVRFAANGEGKRP